MNGWHVAVLTVVSLVAGAAIPLLVQLSLAVRSAREALARTTTRAERALDAVAATAERLDRATAGIDERRVRALMESFDALARTINQLRESARVATALGATVGPAVGAAVRAWRAGHAEDSDDVQHRGGAGPDGTAADGSRRDEDGTAARRRG